MSSVAAYSAFLYGLPLYLLIFWGAVVFLIFAAALNFIHLFIVRRHRLQAGAIDEPKQLEALNTEYQSETKTLRDTIETLQSQHQQDADEIEGRKHAFADLQSKNATLLKQNKGLHAELVKQSWMYNIAGKQADSIDHFVILDRIERGDTRLHDRDGWPFIRFHFYILNKSVYDVAVELDNNARDSYILFKDEGLRSERFLGIPSNELYIPHYTEGCLTIEQRLSPTEAHIIARGEGQDDAVFHFDRLIINIKGRNQEPQVNERRLVIDKAITLNNGP